MLQDIPPVSKSASTVSKSASTVSKSLRLYQKVLRTEVLWNEISFDCIEKCFEQKFCRMIFPIKHPRRYILCMD